MSHKCYLHQSLSIDNTFVEKNKNLFLMGRLTGGFPTTLIDSVQPLLYSVEQTQRSHVTWCLTTRSRCFTQKRVPHSEADASLRSGCLTQRRMLHSEADASLRGGCFTQKRVLHSEAGASLRSGCLTQKRVPPSETGASLRDGCLRGRYA